MKILIAASEVVPFAKTGGLADVAGALPLALEELGHDVRVMMPRYQVVDKKKFKPQMMVESLPVPISDRKEEMNIMQGRLGKAIPVYFIEKDKYYKRPELYGTPHGDYPDNAERFIIFCRAILEGCKALNFKPDIIHCHDWQTGLVPVYLKTLYRDDPFFSKTGSIFTVHNMGYQGVFWHIDMHLTGLGWDIFTPEGIEFYGKINMLKSGLVFSDIINTVSKQYSQEVQTAEYGHGLDGVLQSRNKKFFGIINGIDYKDWNPLTDRYIKENYSSDKMSGKSVNKAELQKEFKLPVKNVPLVGMVGRLTEQKGIDIIAGMIDSLMKLDVQFVLLGTGEEKYHNIFREVGERYKDKAGIRIGFDNGLAHRIYAGSDIFLMPSKYEPCGIGQLISFCYGTIPVARETGGLADTVKEFDSKKKKGNGFIFKEYFSGALLDALNRAIKTYKNKTQWKVLVQNAMKEDFSWKKSAKEYIKLYKKAA
ncbi:MAG: glycogen synthase GlgA [Nitrospirota bacterium]